MIRAHGAVALLVGVAAYANVRAVARDNTDHWLEQTRLLVQEATARLPTTDLAQLATTLRPVARAGGEGDAEVRMVEPLGSETLVHLDAGGQPVVARVPGLIEVPDGQRIGLRVDVKRLHFFDASGARVA